MHDLANRVKRAIGERESAEEHFEGAAITFVRELSLEHVEAELTLSRPILRARNEFELCIAIDESTDQPRACDSIDENPAARYPSPAAVTRRVDFCGSRARPYFGRLDSLRDGSNHFLRHSSAGRTEEIDCDNRGESLPESREVILGARGALTSRVAISATQTAPELTRGVGEFGVVGVAGALKQVLELALREPIDEIGTTDRRVTAAIDDLSANPLKILERLRPVRQHVYRILDRHCTDALEATADPHT